MILRYLNKAMSIILQDLDLTAPIQGTNPLVPGIGYGYGYYSLPDVSSNDFTTLFSASYGLEDVGDIEVMGINVHLYVIYNGNGSVRWQISGVGGGIDANWSTIGQIDFNAVYTLDALIGNGLWIPRIQPGNNKLQFRFQAKANVGTVNTIASDVNEITLIYRKVVLF